MEHPGPTIGPARRLADVGEYYFSRKLAEIRGIDVSGAGVINLGIGSPDLPPAADVIETLTGAARRPDSHAYQAARGIPRLRAAIAAMHRDLFGVALDPETEILPLMGSKEGILHVSLAFVDAGDEVLVPDPGYPTYSSATRLAGGTVRTYRLREERGWDIDVDRLESQDLSRVKVMWLNTPHMPTGSVATGAALERVVSLARTHGFLLVNDNPYAMIGHGPPLSLLAVRGARDVALETGSLSKSHNMAGWRVGWVAGRREFVDLVLRVRSQMDSGTFLPIQLAAAKALEARSPWFAALNATYADRRREAEAIARALGCTFDEGQAGLFLWAKAPDAVADVEAWLDDLLREARVFIAPGAIFGPAGARHVRVSLCAEVPRFRDARRRIDAWHARTSPPADAAALSRPVTGCTAAIVGIGLIGGSMAIAMRESGFARRTCGTDATPGHGELALRRGIVDEIGSLDHALRGADVVVLAVPVDAIEAIAPAILDAVGDHAVVIDAGSTKQAICAAVATHRRRGQFVAAHPIAGTEHSGPEAAVSGLFDGKVVIVCEPDRSSAAALGVAQALFDALGMRTVFMDPGEHDRHLAYVSHLSHVTSFLLGQTVLDIERDEQNIFMLAGSGFESTVRLAKSSPATWAPIFQRNAAFLMKALDEYLAHLQRFRQALDSGRTGDLCAIMTEANEIRRVLADGRPRA